MPDAASPGISGRHRESLDKERPRMTAKAGPSVKSGGPQHIAALGDVLGR